ncbi:BMFP domain-containing protein YqiC [Catenulispora sp. MAP12-49]|uniref:hypothetical protein n=1 Tax=Catenulispora sp. MAP12-49 TaxID=3156302 RepID=UPI003516DA84
MSKLSELVGRLAEKVSAHEARLNALATKAAEHDALVARVAALEAQLAKVTSPDHAEAVQIRDEPTIALAEYRRQLDDVAFDPEAIYGWRRSGAFREGTTLPVGAGVLYMAMEEKSVWSITVLDD